MTNLDIIAAAFKVWGREFYLDTSLSQVARELGVSKSAFYRHFRNKQALLDAMIDHFFDDFSAFIKADYEKALHSGDHVKGMFILIRAIAKYYTQNVNAFLFSMIKLYDYHHCNRNLPEELRSRGVDFGVFYNVIANPLIMQCIFTTLTFFMAVFHSQTKFRTNPPSDEVVSQIIDTIIAIIDRGLCYNGKEIWTLDYEALENLVTATINDIEDDPLLKAVAGAVAQAGPWEASMEQVARRSGLAKSSLYGHFKNKQDMLQQLFMTEFLRIIDFAQQGVRQSAVPLERFYLVIFSIAVYLRSKPNILIALDWIRTRRLDFKKNNNKRPIMAMDDGKNGLPREFQRLFRDIEINPLPGTVRSETSHGGNNSGGMDNKQLIPHWILFLIVNTLMRPGGSDKVKNEDIRYLYRFLTLGVKGFEV